jgi:DNA mismatch repair protein MutH
VEQDELICQPRAAAADALRELVGQDLAALARWYDVKRQAGERLNKGWAGHTLERHLDIALNSSQRPDGGDWELKVVPLKRNSAGGLSVKETMAITMISASDVIATPFKDSHLLIKLRRMLVVGRVYEGPAERRSEISHVATFDLDDHADLLAGVEADYDTIRGMLRVYGIEALSGRIGTLVHPRPKGGAGTAARAFYARPMFVCRMLGL